MSRPFENEITDESIRKGLPHLFAYGWYKWAREFRECRKKIALLCAGNQASKSSSAIRTCIEWATEKSLWQSLWPSKTPNQFWYLYPSQKVVDAETRTKWMEFLPQGIFKTHPKYGWKWLKEGSHTIGIEFNSGVLLFFKTYSQKPEDLQSGSCFVIWADEELPVKHYYELMARISATNGYFRMVFTATLGQAFWQQVLEPDTDGGQQELLPHAWKRQVSLFDCMEYEDGTPSPWTLERIQGVIANCPTHNEVQKRVYGKFLLSHENRKYPTFDSKRHYIPRHSIPPDWEVMVGVDLGSGGEQGHPAAIMFLAVNPEYTQGRFFAGWRGDNCGNTTAGDVMERYLAMKAELNIEPIRKFYDQSCRDFKTISDRIGEGFEASEKSHVIGEEILNLLFKHDMVLIFEDDPELQKFGYEISSLRCTASKNKCKDDMVDAGRYAITKVVWNFDKIREPYKKEEIQEFKEETYEEFCTRSRRERVDGKAPEDPFGEEQTVESEEEINEWQELHDGY